MNIENMSVTLEVTKFSGLLNRDAPCRESKGGHTVRGEEWLWSREAVCDRGARSAQRRARLQIRGSSRGGDASFRCLRKSFYFLHRGPGTSGGTGGGAPSKQSAPVGPGEQGATRA